MVKERKIYKVRHFINCIMKLYQKIIAGGMILGALAGCDGKNNSSNQPLEETVRGQPISVQVAGGANSVRGLSVVVETEKGKYLLCNSSGHYPILGLTDAASLIESEMRDGDTEPIEITGYRQGKKFKMNTVSANGYTIDVR